MTLKQRSKGGKPAPTPRPSLSAKDRTALTRVARMRAFPQQFTADELTWLESERVVALVAAAGGVAAVDAVLPAKVRAEAEKLRAAALTESPAEMLGRMMALGLDCEVAARSVATVYATLLDNRVERGIFRPGVALRPPYKIRWSPPELEVLDLQEGPTSADGMHTLTQRKPVPKGGTLAVHVRNPTDQPRRFVALVSAAPWDGTPLEYPYGDDDVAPGLDPAPTADALPEGPAHFVAVPEAPQHRNHRRRLGRHQWHDPRSRAFHAERAVTVKSVRHQSTVGVFDQGDVGSCTGEAGEGLVSTAPFKECGNQGAALALYEAATRVDGIPGEYPPDDTGSSGLAVAKVLKAQGRIASYRHAFGLQHFLEALTLRPGMVGIKWLTGCDAPNRLGVVRYEGELRGGHEVLAVGIDVTRRVVWFRNSWGAHFGVGGYFGMGFDDVGKALADGGDAIFCH